MTGLIVWLVLLACFVIIELLSLSMTFIWLGAGAAVSAALAALKIQTWVQCVAFVIVSFLLLAFVRPSVKRAYSKKRKSDFAHRLVGKRGTVISEIDNLRGIGQVRVLGQEWSARSEERNVVIPVGTIIDVIGVSGGKLIICLDESMEGNMELYESDATLDPNFIDDNRY